MKLRNILNVRLKLILNRSSFMASSIGRFVCDLIDTYVKYSLWYIVPFIEIEYLTYFFMSKVICQNVDNAGFKVMFYELFSNTKQNKHFKVVARITYTKDVKLSYCQESIHSPDYFKQGPGVA